LGIPLSAVIERWKRKRIDDMEKHNEEVNRLAGQIMEKKKELDATFLMR